VDGGVRRIDSAYDTLGRLTTVTSRNSVTATSPAVNQVARAYGGFGQLTSEWQAHTGLVSTTTTPRVQYAYSQGVGGNHSRLTRTTYPSGYAVDYAYAGIDAAVSRPTSLSGQRANTTASATLEAFKYQERKSTGMILPRHGRHPVHLEPGLRRCLDRPRPLLRVRVSASPQVATGILPVEGEQARPPRQRAGASPARARP